MKFDGGLYARIERLQKAYERAGCGRRRRELQKQIDELTKELDDGELECNAKSQQEDQDAGCGARRD